MAARNPKDAVTLARQLLAALGESDAEPANDDAPEIDEQALREKARRDADEMRRARARKVRG